MQPKRAWNNQREYYACGDGTTIEPLRKTTSVENLNRRKTAPDSCIIYAKDKKTHALVLRTNVSSTKYNRCMETFFGGPDGIRTLTLPRTARSVEGSVFCGTASLRSMALNDGLRMIRYGSDAFRDCQLERMTLPGTLERIDVLDLSGCQRLREIYVADGCRADLASVRLPISAIVGPVPETTVGNSRVWDLRRLKRVIIPNGTKKIGNHWFWGSGVESVEIPASVAEICTSAFHGCRKLKKLVFGGPAAENRLKTIRTGAFRGCSALRGATLPDGLEEIGRWAFAESGLESIATPPSVRKIRPGAFSQCRRLRTVALNEGLETLDGEIEGLYLWAGIFEESLVEDVRLPSTLRQIGRGAF